MAAAATPALIAFSAYSAYQSYKNSKQQPKLPPPPVIPDAPKQPDPTITFADAIARQKRRTAGQQGIGSTLLTGPSGTSAAPTQRSTLLGA